LIHHRGRRQFLGTALASLAGTLLSSRLRAAGAGAALSQLAIDDQLTLIQGAGGNVLLLRTAEGGVLVDGGAAAASAALLARVQSLLGRAPVAALFNTHWHPEQTGSNVALGRRGAKIIAHQNTKGWLSTSFYVDWQDRSYVPLPPVARPNDTFYTTGRTQLGGRTIEYGHLPAAHTDGDLYVRFVDANVIAVGGALGVGRYPLMDYTTGGWLGGVVEASQVLLSMSDAQTRLVAADGAVQSRKDLQAQLDMARATRERIAEAMKRGFSVDDMLAQGLTKDFDPAWGDPRFFLRSSYRGLWGHVRELGAI
jgi:glyoxylase-like metal-dependent hydrolase (beta-lactamase superfamily II)